MNDRRHGERPSIDGFEVVGQGYAALSCSYCSLYRPSCTLENEFATVGGLLGVGTKPSL